MDWVSTKALLADAIGLTRDAIHILGGFTAHILLVAIFRSWIGAIWPLLVILVAALANEWMDLTFEVWTGEARNWQWWEAGKDLLITLLIPACLFLLARVGKPLLAPRQRKAVITDSSDAPPAPAPEPAKSP